MNAVFSWSSSDIWIWLYPNKVSMNISSSNILFFIYLSLFLSLCLKWIVHLGPSLLDKVGKTEDPFDFES